MADEPFVVEAPFVHSQRIEVVHLKTWFDIVTRQHVFAPVLFVREKQLHEKSPLGCPSARTIVLVAAKQLEHIDAGFVSRLLQLPFESMNESHFGWFVLVVFHKALIVINLIEEYPY